jgi:hypothetical protein
MFKNVMKVGHAWKSRIKIFWWKLSCLLQTEKFNQWILQTYLNAREKQIQSSYVTTTCSFTSWYLVILYIFLRESFLPSFLILEINISLLVTLQFIPYGWMCVRDFARLKNGFWQE